MALNAKQRRFVDEYLIDLNATQAAIRGSAQRHHPARERKPDGCITGSTTWAANQH